MNIKWHYHYVHGGDEILPEDIIDISPDKHGRWQIKGYLYSSELDFPVVISVIQKEDLGFKTYLPCMDMNIGLYHKRYHSISPYELMKTIESEFLKFRTILNGA